MAEAAFLSPQSFIQVWAGQQKTEDMYETTDTRIMKVRGLSGTVHIDDRFFIGMDHDSLQTTAGVISPNGSQKWSTGTLGYYINDTTSVWLNYLDWNGMTSDQEEYPCSLTC